MSGAVPPEEPGREHEAPGDGPPDAWQPVPPSSPYATRPPVGASQHTGASPSFPYPPPQSRPVRKHLVLGAILGIAVAVGLPVLLGQVDMAIGGAGSLVFVGLLLALVLAIALTAVPRTRLLGAGMFIGFGVALVAGAGICVALLATMGGLV